MLQSCRSVMLRALCLWLACSPAGFYRASVAEASDVSGDHGVSMLSPSQLSSGASPHRRALHAAKDQLDSLTLQTRAEPEPFPCPAGVQWLGTFCSLALGDQAGDASTRVYYTGCWQRSRSAPVMQRERSWALASQHGVNLLHMPVRYLQSGVMNPDRIPAGPGRDTWTRQICSMGTQCVNYLDDDRDPHIRCDPQIRTREDETHHGGRRVFTHISYRANERGRGHLTRPQEPEESEHDTFPVSPETSPLRGPMRGRPLSSALPIGLAVSKLN